MSYPLSASLRWIYGYEIAACAQRGMELWGREKKRKKKKTARAWLEPSAYASLDGIRRGERTLDSLIGRRALTIAPKVLNI